MALFLSAMLNANHYQCHSQLGEANANHSQLHYHWQFLMGVGLF
jgi:hypothetical protein